MTFYTREIETFREGEIVELTDYAKENIASNTRNYLHPDDKILIKGVGDNGIVRAYNARNGRNYFFRETLLQHIVPEVKACLL